MVGWPDGRIARTHEAPVAMPQPERRHGLQHRAGWDAIRKDIDEHIAAAPGAEFTFATVSVHVLGTDLAVATAPFTVTLRRRTTPPALEVVRQLMAELLVDVGVRGRAGARAAKGGPKAGSMGARPRAA